MAACRREAQEQMGKRLGRNVSDIEERELLKRDAARVADDKLERCTQSGRTRQDCIDKEVKQQIADTLGKNTTEIDESDVRELLEDNARSKAFDSIGECRKQGRSAGVWHVRRGKGGLSQCSRS